MRILSKALTVVLAILIGLTQPMLCLAESVDPSTIAQPAAESPAAETPAAETPAAETPAAETPAAESPAAESPAAESPAVEDASQKENSIDYSRDATNSPAFLSGMAVTLCLTNVFSDAARTVLIGTLDAGDLVEVSQRSGVGSASDGFSVKADTSSGTVTGYLAAADVRPATEEEAAAWARNGSTAAFTPVETPEAGEPKAEAHVDEEPPAENGIEESDGAGLMSFAAPLMLMSLPGATVLTADTATSLSLASGAGTQALASFSMTYAGALTMSFKNLTTTSALTITIKDSTLDAAVWTGTVNAVSTQTFSAFVEAGDYDIIINKAVSTDTAVCTVVVTPSVSLTGELGKNNYTQNNAATIALGSAVTGIYSLQDAQNGRSDYYKLTLSAAGRVRLSVSNLSTAPMTFFLFGDDTSTENQMISMSISADGCANEDSADTKNRTGWLDAGVYYIVATGVTDGRYTMRTEHETIALTEVEPNNTPSQAYTNKSQINLITPTTLNCMLSESDKPDYFYFTLPYATRVSFSVKAQFSNVSAVICRADGSVFSDTEFGASGTSGTYGKPYTMELNNFALAAGNYYLRISHTSTSGSQTTSGLYSVSGTTTMTISNVTATVSANNGSNNILTLNAYVYGGYNPVTLYRYNIFLQEIRTDGTVKNTLVLTRDSDKSGSMSFSLPYTGTYLVQFVCSDGTTYLDSYTTVNATVVPLKVASVSAVSNTSGQIAVTAVVTGYYPVTQVIFSLYKDGGTEPVATYTGGKEMTHTFTAPASGNYSVQFACTDGINWADGWGTCNNVVVPPKVLPLSVSSVVASSDNSGNIAVTTTTKNGYALTYGNYILYRYVNGVATTVTNYLTTKSSQTFKVSVTGKYAVQYVAFDGETWADGWAVFDVALSSAPLSISSLTGKANSSGVITCVASTSGGKKIVQGSLYLYTAGGTLLANAPSTSLTAVFQAPGDGDYLIQCVAYDGVTWADKWASVTVSGMTPVEPFGISSLTLTSQSNGALKCAVTLSGGYTPKQVNYYLYSASGNMLDYAKTTNNLANTFFITSNNTYNVQVVAYNGSTWVDKWAQIVVSNYAPALTRLEVVGLTATQGSTAGVVNLSATLNLSTVLTSSTFYLYQDSKVVYSVKGVNNAATLAHVPNGHYAVQYVAYDGVTYAERWTGLDVSNNAFAVTSTTAVKSGTTLTCVSSVNTTAVLQKAAYYLYNNGVLVGSWTWDGNGSAVTHVFDLSSIPAITSVQFVASDGLLWSDQWAVVK